MPLKKIDIFKIGGQAIASIKIDSRPIDRFIRALNPGSPLLQTVLQAWGITYMAFIRRRFQNFSRGSGDWPPLAESTIAAKGSEILLIDLGVLRRALSPGAPGSTFNLLPGAVQVGVGEPVKHPSGAATIADIMLFHQTGDGVPARPILVVPDQGTAAQMMKSAARAIAGFGRRK